MVMEVVHEDMGETSMQCTNHPYRNSTPGGICAFCLQEKLGKLVSSSFPAAVFPSSSSSSSPSFRSDFGTAASASALQLCPSSSANSKKETTDCKYHGYHTSRRSKLPFIVLTHKKKKKKEGVGMGSSEATSIVFKRSKSTATPRRGGAMHFMDNKYGEEEEDYSPHRRRFWSFLYLSRHTTPKKTVLSTSATTPSSSVVEKRREDLVVVDENGSTDQVSLERKVSRSKSVGCGSRSFSGDFFERISTGFGDCTLRRVESQREGKTKVQSVHRNGGRNNDRVRCGGIFSGFMITSSSSSSSSSSYWVASSSEDSHVNGRSMSSAAVGHLSHGRSKSWGWAFASPMRAFGKPSSASKRDSSSNKNTTPNLAGIPSLLAVRS